LPLGYLQGGIHTLPSRRRLPRVSRNRDSLLAHTVHLLLLYYSRAYPCFEGWRAHLTTNDPIHLVDRLQLLNDVTGRALRVFRKSPWRMRSTSTASDASGCFRQFTTRLGGCVAIRPRLLVPLLHVLYTHSTHTLQWTHTGWVRGESVDTLCV